MDKIKELADFYMWMQENDYDHNIRARVEIKAEMYLNGFNNMEDSTTYGTPNPKWIHKTNPLKTKTNGRIL